MITFQEYRHFKQDLRRVTKKIKLSHRIFKDVKRNPKDIYAYIDFRESVEDFLDSELGGDSLGGDSHDGYNILTSLYNEGITKVDLAFFQAKLKMLGINVKEMAEYRVPEFEDKIQMYYSGKTLFAIKKGWEIIDGKFCPDKEVQEKETVNKNKENKNTEKAKENNTKTKELKNIEDDEELEM